MKLEKVTLAGGCFWCLEAMFKELKGVKSVLSGYAGGKIDDPTYQQISTGTTGYAEVIQIDFNPEIISFKEIIEIFFFIHDPTTLNRQGNDIGTQYRSAVFYHDSEQKQITEDLIKNLEKNTVYTDPIVTEINQYEKFYLAETYHQEYYKNNPDQQYCKIVISPKVSKFRKKYFERLKS